MSSYSRLTRRGKASSSRYIHDGVLYRHMDVTGTIANAESFDVLLQTPDSDTIILLDHVLVNLGGAPHEVEIREGATFSAAGTALNVINTNRRSSNTPDLVTTKAPTITGPGTRLLRWKLLPSSLPSISPLGADDVSIPDDGLVLAADEDYLIRLTNNSGATAGGAISISWAELTQ